MSARRPFHLVLLLASLAMVALIITNWPALLPPPLVRAWAAWPFAVPLSWLVAATFTISVGMVAAVIVLENRNPSKTLAWLIILHFIPIAGFIFYLLLGHDYRRHKIFDRGRLPLELQGDPPAPIAPQLARFLGHRSRLLHLAAANARAAASGGNQVTVLTNGHQTYAAILAALEAAEHHIHLVYFIVRADEVGRKIAAVLMAKARQGVEVRFLYDAVGCMGLPRRYLADLQAAGCQVAPFLPVRIPAISHPIHYRNHRKVVVVDGHTGFVGGINIGDEYTGKHRTGFWRDTHLEVQGPAVHSLQRVFLRDWHFTTGSAPLGAAYFPDLQTPGDQFVHVISDDPDDDWEVILQFYLAAITAAEERLYITTPYFIPDDSLVMALQTAALSGVDVRVILPKHPDKQLVLWASHSYVEKMLRAGVRFYAYNKGFLHAKVLLIDGRIASVGTTNLDLRSFHLNFEVNAFIYDAKTTAQLEADFFADLADSEAITYEAFRQRPVWRRAAESTARLLSPLL